MSAEILRLPVSNRRMPESGMARIGAVASERRKAALYAHLQFIAADAALLLDELAGSTTDRVTRETFKTLAQSYLADAKFYARLLVDTASDSACPPQAENAAGPVPSSPKGSTPAARIFGRTLQQPPDAADRSKSCSPVRGLNSRHSASPTTDGAA